MYIGRFAPSPTGPLHMGSLVTAVASYCEAKSHAGKWLVRIEDVDETRAQAGIDQVILNQLHAFGFRWDGEIIYQSKRTQAYQLAFDRLNQQSLLYPCTCTRKEIADSSQLSGIEGHIYPRTCLQQAIKTHVRPAYRIQTAASQPIDFHDAVYGPQHQQLATAVGDFILKRADGYFAYQLAVVVDDAAQGITHVVRGADLLESTARQCYLQHCLGVSTPQYMHIPLVRNADGEKLSKHSQASPLALGSHHDQHIIQQLHQALCFLGQQPPTQLLKATLSEVWHWAITHWQKSAIRL